MLSIAVLHSHPRVVQALLLSLVGELGALLFVFAGFSSDMFIRLRQVCINELDPLRWAIVRGWL